MALLLKDRVKETTTTEGTGAITLGGAVEGFQSFSAVLSDTDTTYYAITHRDADEWEVGLGTYSSGTLTRTTILESSNSGTAVSFSAGTKDIFITLPAEKALALDGNDVLQIGNITTSGYLRGPATFTIDPAAHGDDTGTVVIAGNLQVDGTTTTINSTTVTIDDLNLLLASGAANAAAANGAGITVDGANATFTYDSASDRWVMNKDLTSNLFGNVTGQVSDISNHSTTNLAEGTNLYYTQARFDTAFGGKSTTDLSEGTNLYYTQGRFDTAFSAKSTSDLTEGTNLYYTTVRANSDFDTRLATKTTADLTEGSNLYYTTARSNTDFDTRLATKSTTDIAEGTNLYYTVARVNAEFDTRLSTKSTTDLAEGTNLYYTSARVNSDIDTRVTKTFVDNLNVDADTLDGLNSTDFDPAGTALALSIALG